MYKLIRGQTVFYEGQKQHLKCRKSELVPVLFYDTVPVSGSLFPLLLRISDSG